MKIAVLGAGAFGRALGGVLVENGHEVDYFDVTLPKSMEEVLDGAEYILLCVPSGVVGEVLPCLPKEQPLIVATKGLLGAAEFAEFQDLMVLSGPAFADEIKAKKQVQLTTTDERVVRLFTTDYLTFDRTTDVQGVLLCGALKNVYALLAGYRGLERETNEWQLFITEAADEMRIILAGNGADAATVDLTCGIGDLRLTCGRPSRNYEFGQMLKNDAAARPDKTVEGWTALAKIKRGVLEIPETAKLIREEMTWG